jgi:hypothetical protein
MFSLTFLLLLYNIIKVETIKALANKAIFTITKVKAKAIKGVILRVISVRLFGLRIY